MALELAEMYRRKPWFCLRNSRRLCSQHRGRGTPVAPHPRTDQRERLDRPDEGVPLEQRLLDPEQAIELSSVKLAQAAPEDEQLRRGDRRDRIQLEKAEPAHRLENPGRGAVEELRAHGYASRFLDAHAPGHLAGAQASAAKG